MDQASQNQTWLTRSLASVWHPCTQMKRHETLPLIPIARGDGVWLYDMDGNRYLDAVSSWWVNLFGHNQPRIKAAITAQMDQLEHVMLAGFTHQPVVELSEQLAELTGLGHAFYGSDGASATEIALKMAAHYWRNLGLPEKNRFVYLQDSYHGETMGALSVTDVPIFRTAYAQLVRENFAVQSPDSRQARGEQSAKDVALWALQDLERVLMAHQHEIAALIVEPLVQGAAGMAMYDPIYLAQARILCDQYSVLLIADEIAVGFGRTGTMFACEQAEIKPDLICLSKGITGGYLPLAAVLCSEAVYTAFYSDETARAFLHSHSYTGNALACAAALAPISSHDCRVMLRSLMPMRLAHSVRVLLSAGCSSSRAARRRRRASRGIGRCKSSTGASANSSSRVASRRSCAPCSAVRVGKPAALVMSSRNRGETATVQQTAGKAGAMAASTNRQ